MFFGEIQSGVCMGYFILKNDQMLYDISVPDFLNQLHLLCGAWHSFGGFHQK